MTDITELRVQTTHMGKDRR